LIISQDLDEILTLCEQIHVLSEGSLSSAVDMKENGLETISQLMVGSEKQ
jgi:simple sugar transport system ATP-binding protein